MRRRKPEPTLLRTEEIFNLAHHIYIYAWYSSSEVVLWSHSKLCTTEKWIAAQLFVISVRGFTHVSPGSPSQCHSQLCYPPTPHESNKMGGVRIGDKTRIFAFCMQNNCLVYPIAAQAAIWPYNLLPSVSIRGPYMCIEMRLGTQNTDKLKWSNLFLLLPATTQELTRSNVTLV